ncbi:MAG TPA: outer membrane beta-barrel protein [Xanthobacteraceae bacterium]
MMKKLLVACIAAAAICGTPANAADMPIKARPLPTAPVSSWTGCYAGGNIGAGWQRTSTRDAEPLTPPPLDTGADTGTGVVGGGQIGCDAQVAPNWVVGIQGMFDGADINGSHVAPFAYALDTTERFSAKADWLATLTGRIGYAVLPQALLYIKGGAAWVRDHYSDVDPTPAVPYVGVANATRTGWTLGGGSEYLLGRNWSVFAEYDYIGLGSDTLPFTYNCGAGCGFNNPYHYSEKQNLQTVLVGLNYRIGGPIVAKY